MLLASCYTILPPLRLEWGSAKIRGFNRETDNYVDYGKRQVCFHNYKTAKFYNKNVLDVEDPTLWQMLLMAKQMSSAEDSPYLFINTNGEHFKTSGAFSQWMSRTFLKVCKKPLSSGMLRKIFVSKITEQANIPRTTEMLALQTASRQMGHSPAMQAKYRRFDDTGTLDDQIASVEQLRLVTPGHSRLQKSTVPMMSGKMKTN